jgi:hypothetical protein
MFWPECHTEKQKRIWQRLLWQILLSTALGVVGVGLTFAIGGLAAHIAIPGAIGGALALGAGMQAGMRTLRQDAMEGGLDWESYFKCAAIGGVVGGVAGGANIGISAAILGAGYAASATAHAVTWAEFLGHGAATGAAGGVIWTVGKDVEGKLVDHEDVRIAEAICNAFGGALIGAVAGGGGAGVTKGLLKMSAFAQSQLTDAIEIVFVRKLAQKVSAGAGFVAQNAVKHTGDDVFRIIRQQLYIKIGTSLLPCSFILACAIMICMMYQNN